MFIGEKKIFLVRITLPDDIYCRLFRFMQVHLNLHLIAKPKKKLYHIFKYIFTFFMKKKKKTSRPIGISYIIDHV